MSPIASIEKHAQPCPVCHEPLGAQSMQASTTSMTCPNCGAKLTRNPDGTWAVAK